MRAKIKFYICRWGGREIYSTEIRLWNHLSGVGDIFELRFDEQKFTGDARVFPLVANDDKYGLLPTLVVEKVTAH